MLPNVSSLLHHFTTYIVVKHDTRFKHTRFGLDKPLRFFGLELKLKSVKVKVKPDPSFSDIYFKCKVSILQGSSLELGPWAVFLAVVGI